MGQVEDVDGGLSFRVDQSHLNVMTEAAKGHADRTEKPGQILRDDLQQRAVGRSGIVKLDPRFDDNPRGFPPRTAAADFHLLWRWDAEPDGA